MDAVATNLSRGRHDAPQVAALLVLGLAVTTIAGAFAFQAAGYAPCELCLKERLPYYVGIALAAVTFLFARRGGSAVTRLCLVLLAALFLFSAGFGAYHAGVEWKFWAGPSGCTGTVDRAATNADFLHQLQNVKVVRCDAVAIRVLGLSLAGWNALISLAIAAAAAFGVSRTR